MPIQNQVKYVPAGTAPMYCGPGDRVSILTTGAETHGSCFIFEGVVAPGGGPPPHIHHHEDESFYILEGNITFHAGGQTILMVTHDDDVAAAADRIVRMRDGRIETDAEEAAAEATLRVF